MYQNIAKHFEVSSLLDIEWGHAVNSKQKLQTALQYSQRGSTHIFLECDVFIDESVSDDAIAKGEDLDLEHVIMSHPPHRTSDLSFKQLLVEVESHLTQVPNARIGLKLDFKSPLVVRPALKHLIENSTIISKLISGPFLIWLNADILAGPVSPGEVPNFDPNFIQTCVELLPSTVLSLGWITGYGPTGDKRYEEAHSQEMLQYLDKYKALDSYVTFPVRAALVKNSWDVLMKLLATRPDKYSLTIWKAVVDNDNVPELIQWIKTQLSTFATPPHVFLDLN